MTKTLLWRTLLNTSRKMDELIEIAEEKCSAFEINQFKIQLDELYDLIEEIRKLPADFQV